MFRNHAALLGSMLFVVLLTSRSLRAQALFQAARTYASGGANAFSIAVGDLNGDGKPDLAVANGCSLCDINGVFGIGVLLGNGDGTFQSARNYVLTGLGPFSVAVADVNEDGKPDLIAATSGVPAAGEGQDHCAVNRASKL
jgi:FG-GAP-like repeat/FG-GAP repeat